VLLHCYIYDPGGATPKSGRGARWLPLNNDSPGGDAPLSGRGARWLPLCYHQLGGTDPHRWPGARKQSVASYMRRNAAAPSQTPSGITHYLIILPFHIWLRYHRIRCQAITPVVMRMIAPATV